MMKNVLSDANRRLTLYDGRTLNKYDGRTLIEIVMVLLLMHVNDASSSTKPSFSDQTDVNINVAKTVGDLFGTFVKHRNQNGEPILSHSLGPVSLNVNERLQPYQYTPENYQYVAPPASPQIQEGYYPSHYYIPTSGKYGPGYYPAAYTSPLNHNQHYYPPYHRRQPYWNQPSELHPYSSEPSQIYTNPYMRPTITPQTNLGPRIPVYDVLNMPSRVPERESAKTPFPSKPLKSGTVITPDSPLYTHIPEEPTNLDIDPRR